MATLSVAGTITVVATDPPASPPSWPGPHLELEDEVDDDPTGPMPAAVPSKVPGSAAPSVRRASALAVPTPLALKPKVVPPVRKSTLAVAGGKLPKTGWEVRRNAGGTGGATARANGAGVGPAKARASGAGARARGTPSNTAGVRRATARANGDGGGGAGPPPKVAGRRAARAAGAVKQARAARQARAAKEGGAKEGGAKERGADKARGAGAGSGAGSSGTSLVTGTNANGTSGTGSGGTGTISTGTISTGTSRARGSSGISVVSVADGTGDANGTSGSNGTGSNGTIGANGAGGTGGAGEGEARASGVKTILRGFTWVTGSQLLTAAGNLVLTPFVIHGLGVQRYGLFALAGTVTMFMSAFNGGLGATANRYFPVYAGTDDRVSTTKLLVTFLCLVGVGGALLSLADWVVSPYIVDELSMSPGLRPGALFLFRALGVLIMFALAHVVVQGVVIARQRFDRVMQAGLLCYALWVAGLVLVVKDHYGLRGVAVIYVVQQAATVAVITPTAMRYLTRRGFSLLKWQELREILGFSARVQVAGVARLVNTEVDTLMVGTALSVHTLGIYNAGANFAQQLAKVMSNVVAPTGVHLGNTFGREGAERAFHNFLRMQRHWAVGVTGWAAVGMAAAYFGVSAWLGPSFHLGGWVAVIALAGVLPTLLVAVASTYVNVMRQSRIEMRYGLVMMAVNLAVTVPLAFVGPLEVVAGMGVAQLASAVYLLAAMRRRIRRDVPNFFRQMPLFRAAAAALVTVGLEFAIRPYVGRGPLGLLACTPPAIAGLALYGLAVAGPGRVLSLATSVVRDRRLPQLV
ncbi:MAG: oligosaccharide flippase family protein [Acidimicrobiales bacterium]